MSGNVPHEADGDRRMIGDPALLTVGKPLSHTDFLIVGIDASSAGVDVSRAFIAALPASSGMAFILSYDADADPDTAMADLSDAHVAVALRHAADGMLIEPDHLYLVPAALRVSFGNGVLGLSPLSASSDQRPFDLLLGSLADVYGRCAVCVVLAETGMAGSPGLRAVKDKEGLVIMRELDGTGDDSMPGYAIPSDAIDLILPLERIPAAIADYGRQLAQVRTIHDVAGEQNPAPPLQAGVAELCQQLVMETYAPAAVLINHKYECLYSVGPTDRYLRVAPGLPTHDLLALARQGVRTRLRSAIYRAIHENARIVIPGGRLNDNDGEGPFHIAVQPVSSNGEELLLICFIDDVILEHRLPEHPPAEPPRDRPATPDDVPQEAAPEEGKAAMQPHPQDIGRYLAASEERVFNEAGLSANQNDQLADKELPTPKAEVQAYNEELVALNHQLREALERQHTISNDLQNLLYSTDVATLLLDGSLNIRFFTPATKALFNIIPGDVGRPLEDLNFLADDDALLTDAREVLRSLMQIEREIPGRGGIWYMRRILPYRTSAETVDGVVITFADITELRQVADALGSAKRQAELATVTKSRFLAAASHDLRQPLQTLVLLQSLLAKTSEAPNTQKLVMRLGETLSTMSGMLNTLLDINQIEAGAVHVDMNAFPINDLLERLRDEFSYHAHASQLSLRVMPCSLLIYSDPRLLEQMLRNLLSNALKYTRRGKVLLGCRQLGEMLRIEVWDTGIGIPEVELEAIFEEYYRLDTMARDRGLGLGLSIVQRLGRLLNHTVRVRSEPGRGSVFSIDARLAPLGLARQISRRPGRDEVGAGSAIYRTGTILVVEDDPEVRELLYLLLKDEGHQVMTASDGIKAVELLGQGIPQPDLILTDYNLPNGLNGLQLVSQIREYFHQEIPVIILTGDISTDTLRNIALQRCVKLNKPVKSSELRQTLQRFLPISRPPASAQGGHVYELRRQAAAPIIYVVDDDHHIRASIRSVLEDDGRIVEDYESCEAFLNAFRPGRGACLLIDAYLPGMSGLQLLQRLHEDGHQLPSVMITGKSDVSVAVQAMKAGVSDFIEKPVGRLELLASIDRALEQSKDTNKLHAWRETAASHVAYLTPRQRQIMEMVLAGQPSKIIAADLGISQRTVESHRAAIMRKTGCKSLPALARLALAAASNNPGLYLIQRDLLTETIEEEVSENSA